MPRVLVADPISAEGIEILRDGGRVEVVVADAISAPDLLDAIGGFDGLVVRSRTKVTREVIARADRLRVVGRSGVGLDNIDVAAAAERGVAVVYAPGASAVSVAELAIGLMLALVRRVAEADRSMRAGKWERAQFVGEELSGKTLGIIGLGNIGREVAKRAAAFGMRILFFDPLRARSLEDLAGVEETDLAGLLESSDIVSVHVPLRDETRHLIGPQALARMRAGAYLVNTARGGLVDEMALLDAIRAGRIAGAALDVFEAEPPVGSALLAEPRVIATPHIGASTREAQERVGREVARQVVRALATSIQHTRNGGR